MFRNVIHIGAAVCALVPSALAAEITPQNIAAVQEIVDDFRSLVPPEYSDGVAARKSAGEDGFSDAFETAIERADCKFGLRFGKQIASSVMSRLRPSCDRLVAPIGNEWIPPEQAAETRAFAACFDKAFSWYAMQIVYQTAELCAWSGFEASITAGQLEYNRCYLEIAKEAQFGNLVKDPYRPGALALVPAASERWKSRLATVRARHGAQSGYLSMLCEIGKADAESGVEPANILTRSGT